MKTISVPIDAQAAARLDLNEARPGDLVEEALSPADFDLRFSAGWVAAVNRAPDSLIVDYEWEMIEGAAALETLEAITLQHAGQSGAGVFLRLARPVGAARRFGTCIHFNF